MTPEGTIVFHLTNSSPTIPVLIRTREFNEPEYPNFLERVEEAFGISSDNDDDTKNGKYNFSDEDDDEQEHPFIGLFLSDSEISDDVFTEDDGELYTTSDEDFADDESDENSLISQSDSSDYDEYGGILFFESGNDEEDASSDFEYMKFP
uniref:Uncharacterized protein n=1 Tax=Panagrolaimus sp. PS1159 TaxID=55785 RepID=A0AC35FBK0_9BILA